MKKKYPKEPLMSPYRRKGFLYGVVIVLIFVGLFTIPHSLAAGVIALLMFGTWIWNLKPPENMDADLSATPEVIERELPDVIDIPKGNELLVEDEYVAGAMTKICPPEVPLGEPRMPAVQICPMPLDKITDQPDQPRH